MTVSRFVSYLRVSTARQGASGLGLEAQREAVACFLNGGAWSLAGEFIEVESGKRSDRPQLAAALARCRLTGATLVVAKIDRLARDASFLMNVVDDSGKGGVVFCDLPQIPAGPVGRFMLQQMAAVAELEAGLISQRTKAALAAAKARGVALGGWRGGPPPDWRSGVSAVQRQADEFAARVGPDVVAMSEAGLSLRAIATELVARGIRTPRDGVWTAATVRNVLARLRPQESARLAA